MSPEDPDRRSPGDRSRDGDERPAPDHADVRRALMGFSELVQRLEEEGRLLQATPYLLGKLGDLRRLLFSYEVRTTGRLEPTADPVERRSRNVVREAIERYEEMIEEWSSGWEPPEEG